MMLKELKLTKSSNKISSFNVKQQSYFIENYNKGFCEIFKIG